MGKARDELVPSRASISVITASVPKARYSLVVGSSSASGTGRMPSDCRSCDECADVTGWREGSVIRSRSFS